MAFVKLVSLSDIRVTVIILVEKCWEPFRGEAKHINLIEVQCLETMENYRPQYTKEPSSSQSRCTECWELHLIQPVVVSKLCSPKEKWKQFSLFPTKNKTKQNKPKQAKSSKQQQQNPTKPPKTLNYKTFTKAIALLCITKSFQNNFYLTLILFFPMLKFL